MLLRALSFGLAAAALFAAPAFADDPADLRATLKAGEQADGFMGLVSGASDAGIGARVNQVNIIRKAAYTDLAAKRGVTVQEVAAATACELFTTKVLPGQFYRDEGGAWRKNTGAVALPSFCPR